MADDDDNKACRGMAGASGAGRVLLVTRHPGAVEWARRRGIRAQVIEHLQPQMLRPGDVVLGVLPVALAAQVCARGARFFALEVAVPPHMRGRELSADELEALGARLVEYRVQRGEEFSLPGDDDEST